MSVFSKTILFSSLIGLFIVIGCSNPTSSKPTNPAIGTWKGIVADSTMTMVMKDSTFSTIMPYGYGVYIVTNVTGSYTIKGDSITMIYQSGLQITPSQSGIPDSEGVPPPFNNPVSGTISGNTMTIPTPYDLNGGSVTLKKQ